MLERRGVISGYEGSKPRQVLVTEADLPRVLAALAGDRRRCPTTTRRLRSARLASRRLMPEIGETLREARMRRRIDMTEVEAATKIRAKYLRALENEEWELLPGPTFVKTFLRTYAEYLELDPRLLVEEYSQRYERPATQDLTPFGPGMSGQRAAPAPAPRRSGRCSSCCVGIVVLLVALYLLGVVRRRRRDDDAEPRRRTPTPTATRHAGARRHAPRRSEEAGARRRGCTLRLDRDRRGLRLPRGRDRQGGGRRRDARGGPEHAGRSARSASA